MEMNSTEVQDVQASDEAIGHMEKLLALHYIDGEVPLAVVAAVEEALKRANRWFPDPQYPYHPNFGYM